MGHCRCRRWVRCHLRDELELEGENHVLRVHWGYYMMYAQQPFHHEDYCWDGGVFVTGGRVVRCSLLRLHGPATPCWEKQIPLDRPFWHWHAESARYRFGGVLFEVEGGPEAVVEVRTKAATLRFSIGEITASRQVSGTSGSVTAMSTSRPCSMAMTRISTPPKRSPR